MKSSQEDIELLEAYLKGRLSTDEMSALETRLKNEPDLNADYNDLSVLVEGMRASVLENKLHMLKEYEHTKYKNEVQKDVSENKNSNPWWKRLMALLLFCLISYLGYKTSAGSEKKIPDEYKKIYAERFDSELILHKTMRAAEQKDSLIQEQRRAYEMYSIQLFDDAIPLLDELWKNQKDTLALFYLGVSKIGIGEIDAGVDILQKPELKKYSEQTNLFIHH